MQDAMFF